MDSEDGRTLTAHSIRGLFTENFPEILNSSENVCFEGLRIRTLKLTFEWLRKSVISPVTRCKNYKQGNFGGFYVRVTSVSLIWNKRKKMCLPHLHNVAFFTIGEGGYRISTNFEFWQLPEVL
jgi:hypothetical protein